jgi:SAM-dependent methyltransferase
MRWSRAFTEPRGTPGAIAGHLLARFNDELNRRAVARLSVPETGHLLEIGFGPGVALGYLAARVPRGRVAGIDPSEVMRAQAERRHRSEVGAGRLELRAGRAEALPWPDRSFDAVLSLNNILLWSPRARGLSECSRVLRPAGSLLVGMHAWAARGQGGPERGDLRALDRMLRADLAAAGFEAVTSEVVPLRVGRALLVSGARPTVARQV